MSRDLDSASSKHFKSPRRTYEVDPSLCQNQRVLNGKSTEHHRPASLQWWPGSSTNDYSIIQRHLLKYEDLSMGCTDILATAEPNLDAILRSTQHIFNSFVFRLPSPRKGGSTGIAHISWHY